MRQGTGAGARGACRRKLDFGIFPVLALAGSDRRAARQDAGAGRAGDAEAQAEVAQRNARDLVETLLGLPLVPDPDQPPIPLLHVAGDAQARASCSLLAL